MPHRTVLVDSNTWSANVSAVSKWIAAGLFVAVYTLAPSMVEAQFGQPGRGNSAATLVIPAPPRELRRDLERARRFVREERYTSAVELLDAILAAPDSEDYFLRGNEDDPSDGDLEAKVPRAPGESNASSAGTTTRTTLKTEACRILGSLPKQGREFYELQVGKTARRALTDAISTRDLSKVDAISRRYFHTSAGYEATLLLARHALDNGLPTTAAIHLSRLREATQAAKKYEPQLTVLLAVAYRLNHDNDKAAALVASMAKSAKQRIQVAGSETDLPSNKQEVDAFLDRLVGTFDAGTQARLTAWRMFRGGEGRNAISSGGMPLQKFEWSVDTAVLISDEEKIARSYDRFREKNLPVIPVAQPLTVGDDLIMQAARMILGVDLQTGLRVWSYPWNTAIEAPEKSKQQLSARSGFAPHRGTLDTRIWRDFVHGQMSSDGDLLFVLRSLESDPPPTRRFNITNMTSSRRNMLVALELATEGKTVWLLGGDEGDDASLRDAFFLGAPLPVDGQLYVVAEIKDELRLLALDGTTGKLNWSQQLGHVESANQMQRFAYPHREVSGACLAHSDGILVCPTSTGKVMAVDTQRRWLLWNFSYGDDSIGANSNVRMFQRHTDPIQGLADQWVDAAPIISDRHVLLTPVESDYLYCLSLLTGELEWRTSRKTAVFVAGVHEGVTIVAHRNHLIGIELASGEPLWKSDIFDEEGLTSGRGFFSDGHYFHPTSAKRLLKFNVKDGSVVESMLFEQMLGNLVCHGDYVISQTHAAVHAFLQRDRIRPYVARQLAENPNNPDALENYANLLLGDGKIDEAVVVLRKAGELAHSNKSAQVIYATLASILLSRLEADFESGSDVLDELGTVLPKCADVKLQQRFHQVVAKGYRATGQPLDAFRELVSYVELLSTGDSENQPQTKRIDDTHRLHVALWVADEFEQLLNEMDDADRSVALKHVSQIESNLATTDSFRWETWLRCVSKLPTWKNSQLQWSELCLKENQVAQAELLLAKLFQQLPRTTPAIAGEADESDDPVVVDPAAVAASEKLVQLLTSRGEFATAGHVLNRLKELSDASNVAGMKRISTLSDELSRRSSEDKYGLANWPQGAVTSTPKPAAPRIGNPAIRSVAVEMNANAPLWPADYRIELDAQWITIYDGYNRVWRQVPLERRQIIRKNVTEFVARGHLLIGLNGNEAFAVDLLGDYTDSKLRIRWSHDVSTERQKLNTSETRIAFGRSNPLLKGQGRNLGPASADGVTFIQRDSLVCVDLWSGETLWKVSGVGPAPTIFGNEDTVFVVRKESKVAQQFDMRNGNDLGNVELPFTKNQWRPFGQYLLGWETDDMLQLKVFDPIQRETVWKQEFAAAALAQAINASEIALCDPDGTLQIIELATGRVIVDDQVETGGKVANLVVQETPDQYIIGVGKIKNNGQSRFIQTTAGFHLTGQLYAYDRISGERAWPQPTEVTDYQLLPRQAVRTPILAFARAYNVPRSSAPNQRRRVNELALIDRRDGSVVFRERQQATHQFRLSANPRKATLELEHLYGQAGHTIAFTDTPVEDDKNPVNKLAPDDVKPKEEAKSEDEPFRNKGTKDGKGDK